MMSVAQVPHRGEPSDRDSGTPVITEAQLPERLAFRRPTQQPGTRGPTTQACTRPA